MNNQVKITILSLLIHLLMTATVQFVSKRSKIRFVTKQNVVGITSALNALLELKIWKPNVQCAVVVALMLLKINFSLVSS